MDNLITINVEEFLKNSKKQVMDLNPFGKKYFVIKNKLESNDVLQLVSSDCPHQGLPLEPIADGESLVCPWHGCVFDYSGRDPSIPDYMKLKIIDTLKVSGGKISI